MSKPWRSHNVAFYSSKSIMELYGQGDSYEVLHSQTRSNAPLWQQYAEDTTFKFQIVAHNHSIPGHRKIVIMENFGYMDWKGVIDVQNPALTLLCIEEYPLKGSKMWSRYEGDGNFMQAYFGRLVTQDTARELITTFDVKKRQYFGNTSMDAEISLLMANQALARPGSFLYDPFIGTGSMLYTCAHFGAIFFGSDIDGRQMRGKTSEPGIIRAATQYHVPLRIAGLATFDMTKHPFRCGSIFDAIVTDPPYGVRAGAKRLGRRKPLKENKTHVPGYLRQGYIPPTRPYELADLAGDLLLFARYLLRPGGRLVFFLPTVNDEYQEIDLPSCDGMALVSNSLQDFGNWGRRLITMEKTSDQQYDPPAFDSRIDNEVEGGHQPAHMKFRDKYFTGFGNVT